MFLPVEKCNPFIRNAEITPAILEGEGMRKPYDNRLFYVLEGIGKIIIENKDYEISGGTLIYIPVSVKYTFRGKMKVIVINFDFTRDFDGEKTPICPPPESQFDENLMYDPTLAEGFEIPLVFNNYHNFASELTETVSIFSRKDASSDALCSAKLKFILATIAEKSDDSETNIGAKVKGYIAMYATENKSTGEIAKHFGYHPVYLESVFKKKTGQTIHSAIIDERIKIACRWLLNTNATLDVIAENTGFSSRTHFCTIFKAKTGLTPSVWRRQHSK